MLKTSILLFISIFVLLFIGLMDYGYACHKGEPPGEPHGPKGTCGTEPPPLDPTGPRIAVVLNNGGGGAAAFITEKLDGIYTKVRIKNFNDWDAFTLREKFDVLHFVYSSPPSIDANWTKLLAFMNAELVGCGTLDHPPCIGGGILFEDPANVEDMMSDVGIKDVELNAPGPTIVDFSGPLALSAFATEFNGNNTGSFLPGDDTVCANVEPTGTRRGLGYGCLVNNHITFADVQPTKNGLKPLLQLVSTPAGAVVALYGEGGIFGNGKILIKGPDNGFHAGGGGGDFKANHFCLLTNEIIWVSQAVDSAPDYLVSNAVNNCVDNAITFLEPQQ